MGKELYQNNPTAKALFDKADEILGFNITKVMFEGTAEDLLATEVTQPAVFLYSYISFVCLAQSKPDMVGGHSLGEFSALAAAGALEFEDALRLVSLRAHAMQRCCDKVPGTMAAIIGLDKATLESVCRDINDNAGLGTLVPANYNSAVQIAVSGTKEAVALACERMKEAGAKRAVPLSVGGAFHSPLMEPARTLLAEAIDKTPFKTPLCPVFQNVTALCSTDPVLIKENLLRQLTSPVRWSEEVLNMRAAGADEFIESGSAATLLGLIRKTLPSLEGVALSSLNA